jgi:hypothetical protein
MMMSHKLTIQCSANPCAHRDTTMTTLEIKFDLPDRLAREAKEAGLLTPGALSDLVREAMRRRAAQTLLAGSARASQSGSGAISLADIQAEVRAVRRERTATKSQTA